MRILLIGPAGCGKGTQAKLLSQRLQLFYFGTGDLLREAVQLGTPAGVRADPFMKQGQFVPDDLVNDLVAERFRRDDRPEHFVMDGYPRTLAQAVAFEQILRQQFLNLQSVVQILVDDEELVKRTSGRRTCPQCHAIYHVTTNPPKQPGRCDNDDVALEQRADDQEQTVRHRLDVYHQKNVALLEHYKNQGLLKRVSGVGDIEHVYAEIVRAATETHK